MPRVQKLILQTDGASRGNPGLGGAGVILTDGHHHRLETIGKFLGVTTNNQAEYQALIAGLEAAARYAPESVTVESDSQLMVRQMNGEYRVRNPSILPLYLQAVELAQALPSVTFTYVPREQNGDADRLANLAIDSRGRRVAMDD